MDGNKPKHVIMFLDIKQYSNIQNIIGDADEESMETY